MYSRLEHIIDLPRLTYQTKVADTRLQLLDDITYQTKVADTLVQLLDDITGELDEPSTRFASQQQLILRRPLAVFNLKLISWIRVR